MTTIYVTFGQRYRLAYATNPGIGSFPHGCLARFGVTDEGRVHDLEEITRA